MMLTKTGALLLRGGLAGAACLSVMGSGMADVGPYPSPDPLQRNAETAAFHSFMGHPTMGAIEALLEGFLHAPGLWPPVTSVSSSTPFVRHFPAQFPPF